MLKGSVATLGAIVLLTAAGAAQAPPVTFDAADIQVRARTGNANAQMTGGFLRGNRFDLRNATMVDLITMAHGVEPNLVVGGPSWLEMERFDILAKAPDGTPQTVLRTMLQNLLADRFKLTVHRDTRPVPGWALVSGTDRHKLKPPTAGEKPGCMPLPSPPPPPGVPAAFADSNYACRGISMASFATRLRGMGSATSYFTEMVADQTGLDGNWDFDFKWTHRLSVSAAGPDAVTLFAAIEKQLGLKLVPQNLPAPVLIVDAVNKNPTPNPPGNAKDLPPLPPAQFEVATVKPTPDDVLQPISRILPTGRVEIQGMTMRGLLGLVWNINDDQLIANAPGWFNTTRYSILAIASSAAPEPGSSPLLFDIDDLKLMLRSLLTERFNLKTHFEDRPVSAYSLLADNPKMTKANPEDRTRLRNGPLPGQADPRDRNPALSLLVTCQNMTMAEFAELLPRIGVGYFRLPVANETGLDGGYTFTLSFSPILTAQRAATAADPFGAISLIDAVDRQLGLKLEMNKRPMPVMIIDHADETPVEN